MSSSGEVGHVTMDIIENHITGARAKEAHFGKNFRLKVVLCFEGTLDTLLEEFRIEVENCLSISFGKKKKYVKRSLRMEIGKNRLDMWII